MAQIDSDFRHHLVNGLCSIRASEQNLKGGQLLPSEQKCEADNIDRELKRIFSALNVYENKICDDSRGQGQQDISLEDWDAIENKD